MAASASGSSVAVTGCAAEVPHGCHNPLLVGNEASHAVQPTQSTLPHWSVSLQLPSIPVQEDYNRYI